MPTMESGRGEQFPKHSRLRKRAEYLDVQRGGHKVLSRAFVGLVLARDANHTRLGITTTKRIGKAAARNRTRRLVREAFRRGWLRLPAGIDLVIIAKKSAIELDSQSMFDDLSKLGRQVTRFVERHY